MQLVLCMQVEALQFVGAIVVIRAFLGLIGERVEVALVGTVIVAAFLRWGRRYLSIAVAIGGRIVQEGMAEVRIASSINLRVKLIAKLLRMLIVESTFLCLIDLQKLLDGSAVTQTLYLLLCCVVLLVWLIDFLLHSYLDRINNINWGKGEIRSRVDGRFLMGAKGHRGEGKWGRKFEMFLRDLGWVLS